MPGVAWERQHFYVRAIYLRGEYLLDRELRSAIEQEHGEGSSLTTGPALPVLITEPEPADDLWTLRDPRRPPEGMPPSMWRRVCRGQLSEEDAAAELAGTMTESSAMRRDPKVGADQAERMGFTIREV
jgi:hypothetical protein